MVQTIALDETTMYTEHKSWMCKVNGADVGLGIVMEVVKGDDGPYPYIVLGQLLPRIEYIDPEIIDNTVESDDPSKEEVILQIYHQLGGVPFNVDSIQPPKSSCGFSSFIADSSIIDDGHIEVRHFMDVQDARKFILDFYIPYAHGLFTFIDDLLDNQTPSGISGRQLIARIIENG